MRSHIKPECQRRDHNSSTNDWNLQVLIDWINSELEEERIIVKDLEEDCYDGQVLQKLFGEKQPFGTLTYRPTYLTPDGSYEVWINPFSSS